MSRLIQYIEVHPDVREDPNRWIEGMGWDQTKWHGAQFPTAVRVLSITFDICIFVNFLTRTISTGSLFYVVGRLLWYASMDMLRGYPRESLD
jgi:hypothetical protein